MQALIRFFYNMFSPFFWGFLVFSIMVFIAHLFSGVIPNWNCEWNKTQVKIVLYENSAGDGGGVYSKGFVGEKEIKINGYLKADSVYTVWSCYKSDFAYLAEPPSETPEQYKHRKALDRLGIFTVFISINIVLFVLSKIFGRLMRKYNISNDAD